MGRCVSQWVASFAVVLASFLVATLGYRIHNPEVSELPATPAFFPPYSLGFTGRAGAPTNPGRIRVNEGNQFTQTQPNLFEGVHPRRTCPTVVRLWRCCGCVSHVANAGAWLCPQKTALRWYRSVKEPRPSTTARTNRQGTATDGQAPAFAMTAMPVWTAPSATTHIMSKGSCALRRVSSRVTPSMRTQWRSHHRVAALCPNDCSGQGICDYATGRCQCNPNRVGDDCSVCACPRHVACVAAVSNVWGCACACACAVVQFTAL